MVADGSRREKEPELEGPGQVSWAGRARVGSGRSLAGWQGRRVRPHLHLRSQGRRMNGLRMGVSESCPLLGARGRAWGRRKQDSSIPTSSLIVYLVTCVSESYLKSLFEWNGERKERKKEKTEKVGPPILSLMGEARCLLGTQTRSRLRDRQTHVSPIEPLRLWTSGLGGMGRDQTDQSQGRAGVQEES